MQDESFQVWRDNFLNLTKFTEGFIEATLWSTLNANHESDPDSPECLDGAEETDPETLESLERLATRFYHANEAELEQAAKHRQTPDGKPWEYLGHDAWLSMAGHGTGFWDREDIPEPIRSILNNSASRQFDQTSAYGWIFRDTAHMELV
ncbi:MAG: hypothetical protein KDB61_00865 [Planctomycetes bacterium]|nr:hypothetical protein [Planctomycetota bacterium]